MTAVASLQSARLNTSDEGARQGPSSTTLLDLARSRSTDDRQRLLLGVVALCETTPPGAEVSPVLADIFMTLARQAERDIRRALAESVAGSDWAPVALINMLALDEIDIARPIIARSRLIDDQQLLRILVEATIEHQIEVARRPGLSGRVADAIIEAAEPATMTALASNRTAEISEDGLRRLIEQSRRVAALRAPLTRHPRLNESLATDLYKWVGQALRQAIGERFRVDDAALAPAIDSAVAVATGSSQHTIISPAAQANVAEREEMERRLVAKLQTAGQLRPGFLIRAIREKRLSLFEHGLCALTGFSLVQVRGAIMRPSPDALFLACSAVGIDRAVFPAILDEVRKLTDGWPGLAAAADRLPGSLSASDSAREFRNMIGKAAGN